MSVSTNDSPTEHPESAALDGLKKRLEIEKLEVELAKARLDAPLHQRKIELEIAELKRSHWLRPGTMIPILVTVCTVIFAQVQGVFEVASRRAQAEAAEVRVQLGKLNDQRTETKRDLETLEKTRQELAVAVRSLKTDQEDLERRKIEIAAENEGLKTALTSAKDERARLATEAASVRTEIDSLRTRFDAAYRSFRERAIERLVYNVQAKCVAPPARYLWFNVKLDPDESPMPSAADAVLPDNVEQCFIGVVNGTIELSALEVADRQKLLDLAGRISQRVASVRSEAARSYESRQYASSIPAFAKVNANADSDLAQAPGEDAKKAVWLENRRKSRLLHQYTIAVDSPVRAIQNLWAGEPRRD